MILAAHVAAVVAALSAGVVYGTDVFCAVVQRPALARVDDAALTAVMGNVHRFGDRRLPIPGVLGILGAVAASMLAALADRPIAAAAAGAALVLLVTWMVVYLRVSAPINHVLTAATESLDTPAKTAALQRHWDRVIVPRAVLRVPAVLALCASLVT